MEFVHDSRWIQLRCSSDEKKQADPNDEQLVEFVDCTGLDPVVVFLSLLAKVDPFIDMTHANANTVVSKNAPLCFEPYGLNLNEFRSQFPMLDPTSYDSHLSAGAMADVVSVLHDRERKRQLALQDKLMVNCDSCGAMSLLVQNSRRRACASCEQANTDSNNSTTFMSLDNKCANWALRKWGEGGQLAVESWISPIIRQPIAFRQVTKDRFLVLDIVRDTVYLRDIVTTQKQWFSLYEILPERDIRAAMFTSNTCFFFSHLMPSVARFMAGSFHSMVLDVPDLRDFTVTTFRDTVVLVGGQDPQGKCSDQSHEVRLENKIVGTVTRFTSMFVWAWRSRV
jgi:hypothetical protein